MLSGMAGVLRKRAFFWRWLKAALRPSWGIAETVAGVVGVVGGAIGHFIPAIGAVVDSLGWAIALGALVAIVLYRLFMAPYWMAKEDQARISQLEAEKAARDDVERRNASIADLIERADEIHRRRIAVELEVVQLRNDAVKWLADAIAAVSAISPAKARVFKTLPTGVGISWNGSFNDEHNTIRTNINRWKERLAEFVT